MIVSFSAPSFRVAFRLATVAAVCVSSLAAAQDVPDDWRVRTSENFTLQDTFGGQGQFFLDRFRPESSMQLAIGGPWFLGTADLGKEGTVERAATWTIVSAAPMGYSLLLRAEGTEIPVAGGKSISALPSAEYEQWPLGEKHWGYRVRSGTDLVVKKAPKNMWSFVPVSDLLVASRTMPTEGSGSVVQTDFRIDFGKEPAMQPLHMKIFLTVATY